MALDLAGVKIIQTAAAAAGPMAGRLLADWGADVICVEHTTRKAQKEQRRSNPQMDGRRIIVSDIDYAALNHNRNKRGMTLNLATKDGQEILNKLLAKSDVLLSNFRQRELEKFQLEYETLSRLNPGIICAHLTGFGKKGPDKDEPGYGPTAGDARSGFLHVIQAPGMEPPQMPMSFADYLAGLALAFGIMTALFIRERTGVGQEVDASLYKTMTWAISNDIAGTLVTGRDRQAVSRKDRGTPQMTTYRTKDGRWLHLSTGRRDVFWPTFCQIIDREDLKNDPRYTSFEVKEADQLALFKILEEIFLTRTLEEWKQRFKAGVYPWAPLQNLPEVINDPQARINNFFVPLDHPTHGRIEVMTGPVNLSKTPEVMRMPAPESGQHTDEILRELGYTGADIGRYRQEGIIL